MHILYIEDTPLNAIFLSALCKQQFGVEATIAETGEEGLELLNKDKFDIVFIDINLPGISGIDVITTIRENEEFKELPLVAVSADATKKTITKAKDAGVDQYLTKPVNLSNFIETVNELVTATN